MLRKFLTAVGFAILASCFSASAFAQAANDESTMVNGYVLGAGDVIEVSVLGQEEYKARIQVQTDGTIQLPFISTVPAADKTVLALRNDVASRLKSGGYYAKPVVNIAIVGYASRYVVVLGEVGNPGIVPIDRAYRVSEILARVGGLRANAAEQVSLRRASGEEQMLDLQDIATGGNETDPLVGDGDKLFVDQAKTFYIYGQVNTPGTYKLARGLTLRMALARGGGLTALGSEKRIKIVRDGKEIKKADLATPLLADDVIIVGERFF